jgi:hypothetical protein
VAESLDIAVVGPTQEDDFAWNIAAGLRALGHRPTLVGALVPSFGSGTLAKVVAGAQVSALRHPRTRGPVVRGLRSRLLDRRFDLALTVQSLPPDLVREVVAAGTPVTFWFPDCVANLGALWMFEAPYTALFFKDPLLVIRLRAVQGLPVHYLPEACNPDIHRVPNDPRNDPGIVVAGNYYSTRLRLLERLARDGVDLRLYGGRFPADSAESPIAAIHSHEYVTGTTKARVFAGARAVLNNLHPAEMDGMNCRLFEAAACGAVVVTEERGALRELFQVGDEVLAFSDYDGLLRILRGLDHDAYDTPAIRQSAATRAHLDHTYELRLGSLLGACGR